MNEDIKECLVLSEWTSLKLSKQNFARKLATGIQIARNPQAEQSYEWNIERFNFLSSIDISGFPGRKAVTYDKIERLTIFRKRRGPYDGQQDPFLYQLVSASSYRDLPLERCNREKQPLVSILTLPISLHSTSEYSYSVFSIIFHSLPL